MGAVRMWIMNRSILVVAVSALLWWGAWVPAASGSEGHVTISFQPRWLSIEARGVTLPEVLHVIGAKAGFTVVDRGASRQPLTLSLKEVPLEEALRQLLRSENHAILYRGQAEGKIGGTIEKIVLLGPHPYAEDVPDRRERWPFRKRAQGIPNGLAELSQSIDWGDATQSTTSLYEQGGQTPYSVTGEEATDVTVEGILRLHASHGIQVLPEDIPSVTLSALVNQPSGNTAQTARETPTGGMPAMTLPSALDETLAITTRLARQQLRALIEGLGTATSSLLESSAPEGR